MSAVAFERGQFTAIMGPSGSGKSTLMHCMAGLDTATSGSAFIGDVDLTTLDDKRLTRLRRDSLGFIFQAYNLVPTLTAIENITLPMDIAGRKPDQEWLDGVIDHRRPGATGCTTGPASCPAVSSSGSPCARALAGRPEVVFADEPTGNLDSRAGAEVLTSCRSRSARWARRSSSSPTTRPPPAYADRVVFLADGRIVDEMHVPDRRVRCSTG